MRKIILIVATLLLVVPAATAQQRVKYNQYGV